MKKDQFGKGHLFYGCIFSLKQLCCSSLEMNFFITRVSKSHFNFISTIIKWGWFFPNLWFGLHSRWLFSNIFSKISQVVIETLWRHEPLNIYIGPESLEATGITLMIFQYSLTPFFKKVSVNVKGCKTQIYIFMQILVCDLLTGLVCVFLTLSCKLITQGLSI